MDEVYLIVCGSKAYDRILVDFDYEIKDKLNFRSIPVIKNDQLCKIDEIKMIKNKQLADILLGRPYVFTANEKVKSHKL